MKSLVQMFSKSSEKKKKNIRGNMTAVYKIINGQKGQPVWVFTLFLCDISKLTAEALILATHFQKIKGCTLQTMHN